MHAFEFYRQSYVLPCGEVGKSLDDTEQPVIASLMIKHNTYHDNDKFWRFIDNSCLSLKTLFDVYLGSVSTFLWDIFHSIGTFAVTVNFSLYYIYTACNMYFAGWVNKLTQVVKYHTCYHQHQPDLFNVYHLNVTNMRMWRQLMF